MYLKKLKYIMGCFACFASASLLFWLTLRNELLTTTLSRRKCTNGVIIRAYENKYSNYGPGGWVRFVREAFMVQYGMDVQYQEDPFNLTSLNHCPIQAIIYQMPELYDFDFNSTHGEIAQYSSKILHGPFMPLPYNSTGKLCDNVRAYEGCKALVNKHHGRCYFFPQCSRNNSSPSPRNKAVLYLKTFAVENKDIYDNFIIAIVIPKMTTQIKSRFPQLDIVTFIYGHYYHEQFLQSLQKTLFGIVYSPMETMGLYHLEMRSYGVPLFALQHEAVNFFGSKSGISVDSRLAYKSNETEELIMKPFSVFLSSIATYRPLHDLYDNRLLYPNCGKIMEIINS